METGRGVWAGGEDSTSQISAIQLTLSQSGVADYAHHITTCSPPPPDFQTFLLPTLGRHRGLTSGGKMMILLRPFSSLLVTSTGAGPVMIRIPG